MGSDAERVAFGRWDCAAYTRYDVATHLTMVHTLASVSLCKMKYHADQCGTSTESSLADGRDNA